MTVRRITVANGADNDCDTGTAGVSPAMSAKREQGFATDILAAGSRLN
jgi:hypothetical protein